jgi:hypothetical protein
LVLTVEKSCWKKGADRITATDAVTATRNRSGRISDCVWRPPAEMGLERSRGARHESPAAKASIHMPDMDD